MITIDGSLGEGGGQILRTALGLSLATGKAFHIKNIRARRPKPGLGHQHLLAARSARQVGNARVEGAALGSSELLFEPQEIVPGDYRFSLGTAGSTGLVLQTVLPALIRADEPSNLTLQGGTHNPFAPPFDFLERTFFSLLRKMGVDLKAELRRPGFYPRGGGEMRLKINPTKKLTAIHIKARGHVQRISAKVHLAGLPRHIAERELKVMRRKLEIREEHTEIVVHPGHYGPGNVLIVQIEADEITEVFTGFGTRGVRAEMVAQRTAREVQTYLDSGAPVGPYLADQLLIPFALAAEGSFKTSALTAHAQTNIEIIRTFLETPLSVDSASPNETILSFGEAKNFVH